MPPKKKLSKKEKARLEAEQAELLRIEMEKEKQRKLEEERQRMEIEREQAKKRQQEEIVENKARRLQLKNSMTFFNDIQDTIEAIKFNDRERRDWKKFMRCNGLPNASSPSELRKYIHQWMEDREQRQQMSRNWLLKTDERTLLTQDSNVADLTRATLKKQQGKLGDVYAQRAKEVLGILTELDEVLEDKNVPSHIAADLNRLKLEIRILLKEHLDEFSHKILTYIERDMEVERPGVSRHDFISEVFKSQIWSYSKDAQISSNTKSLIPDPNQHHEIEFTVIELDISLPPVVKLEMSALRGLWLNYDHFSDFCPSYYHKRVRSDKMNILSQTKWEWHKRKEILQNMLDDCNKESPVSVFDPELSPSQQQPPERNFDVDKIYAEYEDAMNKARRRAIGPESLNLLETDINLRKYRIIGGIYCIDYLETPQQDKRINARSFIRTLETADGLVHKTFYKVYKPPPPVLPGVRRLPEEIEAEIRMIEAALDKLALVTIQLSDSVIWFEPPIPCRWETVQETLESELEEGVKQSEANSTNKGDANTSAANNDSTNANTNTSADTNQNTSANTNVNTNPNTNNNDTNAAINNINVNETASAPAPLTPLSSCNPSPLKGSPRFPTHPNMFKHSSYKSTTPAPLPIREINDFDMLNIPHGIDIYGLIKDFIVPRLPIGFNVRLCENDNNDNDNVNNNDNDDDEDVSASAVAERQSKWKNKLQTVMFIARHKNVNIGRPSEMKDRTSTDNRQSRRQLQRITEDFLSNDEPRELFPCVHFEKELRIIKESMDEGDGSDDQKLPIEKFTHEAKKVVKIHETLSELKSGVTFRPVSEKERKKMQNEEDEEQEVKTYMFSQLIEDLDRLCALEMPLQEEALQNISSNLSSSRSNSMDSHNDANDEKLTATTNEALAPSAASIPSFPFFSFLREVEKKIEEPVQELVEVVSSSSEYDEDEFAELEWLEAADGGEQQLEDGEATAIERTKHLTTPGTEIHDFLNKHGQSESGDIGADGKGKLTAITADDAALSKGKWSTRDVHDTKFNEDKFSIQFRTGRLGFFGFALNRYSNMPYQAWEIKPDFKSPNNIQFSLTASIISLDMTITPEGYCVNNFQGGSTEAINEMIGKTLSLGELKSILISSAVDIFPDDDAFCYTEGSCEKNFIMEMHLYACMSTLGLSHNFSWSRWNLLAGSRTAVILIREMIEGKKVPNHSTLLVTPLKTAIIECTEVSPSFNTTGIPGMDYYADLYQLAQVHAQPSSLEKQQTMNPVLRDNVAQILMATRPISFC